MTSKLFAMGFGLLGLLIPVAFLIFRNPLFPNWVIYFWPSSIFLLATDGHEKSLQAFLILVVAVIVNVLVYLFAGWVISRLVSAMIRS
jgi:hypothetical protein